MCPDLVVLHPHGDELVASILEPHDPGRDDNFEKAVGLAEFAGKYGHLFDRIELIRKQAAASGGKMFKRLNLNRETVRQKVLPVTSNPQLDAVFRELTI